MTLLFPQLAHEMTPVKRKGELFFRIKTLCDGCEDEMLHDMSNDPAKEPPILLCDMCRGD